MNSPTSSRLVFLFMFPFGSVEQDVDCAITPDQYVVASLTQGAVEPTVGDPDVDRPDADTEQLGKQFGRENQRHRWPIATSKRAGDLRLRQRAFSHWRRTWR